ncbi:MAG: aldehyde dehydrogenase family protein [Candidatus Dormibacterales bacterium]
MALPVPKTHKLYVGGEFVRSESGRSYKVGGVNVPRGSRKDLRDAVRAARAAFPGWSGRPAFNRGQVLYRVAEMLQGRRSEMSRLLGGGRAGGREVDACVDALIWYAGWTDKLHQVAGTVNPVAGPYFNFTVPEPTGVVGAVSPARPRLLGLVRRLAPALCGGNTVVALASEEDPIPALTFAEAVATGDVPPGVVNVLSGRHDELLDWLGGHMDVNAIDAAGCTPAQLARLQELAATNVKRVVASHGRDEMSPHAATALMEFKTVWHPIGT